MQTNKKPLPENNVPQKPGVLDARARLNGLVATLNGNKAIENAQENGISL